MTNEGADKPVRCQKNEESLIPVYRPVRSGLTGSTGSIYDSGINKKIDGQQHQLKQTFKKSKEG
jgi:hypothetical protein